MSKKADARMHRLIQEEQQCCAIISRLIGERCWRAYHNHFIVVKDFRCVELKSFVNALGSDAIEAIRKILGNLSDTNTYRTFDNIFIQYLDSVDG